MTASLAQSFCVRRQLADVFSRRNDPLQKTSMITEVKRHCASTDSAHTGLSCSDIPAVREKEAITKLASFLYCLFFTFF